MIALVIYYNSTFESLRTEYNTALDELDNMTVQAKLAKEDLEARKADLDELWKRHQDVLTDANMSERRVETIKDIYAEEKNRAEKLSLSLNSTLDERNRYESLYNEYFDLNRQNELRYLQAKENYEGERAKMLSARSSAVSIQDRAMMIEAKTTQIFGRLSSIQARADDIRFNNSESQESDARVIEDQAIQAESELRTILEDIARIISAAQGIGGS